MMGPLRKRRMVLHLMVECPRPLMNGARQPGRYIVPCMYASKSHGLTVVFIEGDQ